MRHPYPCEFDTDIMACSPETDFCTCPGKRPLITSTQTQRKHKIVLNLLSVVLAITGLFAGSTAITVLCGILAGCFFVIATDRATRSK